MTSVLTSQSPYPGLRPFSEAESLYFKGREGHIASIQQELMAKRFLMVTGASGDGKSSLVYAGLLPNVRAGFLRGEFGKWAVAILRPGHTPMQNLSDALSRVAKEKSPEEIKEQLKYGYSALANLYKQSNLFINKEDSSFIELDEKEQKKALRKGSNLLIVVDQFEEFFTSDNNFNKETALPGVEAMLVMNLLIETARLAKEQNLPIYIICTMRSDYIGNAPAYRGLPELIGNNQFFVPRLIREELVQVIEEPANLNGNAISKRLVQRLINDLDVVNTDVLPSLQHGLRQIWEHAEKGMREMDLFHYAQVGGMNSDELPEKDIKEFSIWFDELPVYHQQLIKNSKPGISNILNLHANLLYETAHEQQTVSINKEQSQQILKRVFQCLTQIDDSRAVRHRMTIDQIKEIAKTDGVTINALLKIFRVQGNTLIYPFLLSDEDKEELPGNTLLDITHEALIRNWKLLLLWTQDEYENVLDYRELDTAVQRWKQEGRKKEYLFSEGTYEHIVKRHGDTLPFAEWVIRYVDHSLYVTDGRAEKRIAENQLNEDELRLKAEENCAEIKDFFAASKNEIEAIKKKRKRMLLSLAIICVLVSVGFFWATSMWRKADKLQKEIATTSKANSIATKAYTLLESDPTLAYRLAEESYKIEPTPLNQQVIMACYAQMPFYQKYTAHSMSVNYAEYSPDGNYFVTASDDNFAIVWNNNGTIKVKLKHDGPLSYQTRSALFSQDSKLILTLSTDSTARLWNLNGNCLSIMRSTNSIESACFSPDGLQILTGSTDQTTRLWDLKGKEMLKLKLDKKISHVDFLDGGNTIMAVGDVITLWDKSGKKTRELTGENRFYGYNTISACKGKIILVGDREGALYAWSSKGALLFKKKGHKEKISWIDVSPDSRFIVTASHDKNICLWDMNGTLLNTLRGHTGDLQMVNFSCDGKKIVSASNDGTARLWDVSTITNTNLEGRELMVIKGHTSQVLSCRFSPNGKNIITTSVDNTARIWDIDPKENPLFKEHTGYVVDANYSPDGKKIITSGWDHTARIWNKNGKQENVLKHHSYYVVSQAIYLTNETIYCNNNDAGEIVIWNTLGKPADTLKIKEPIKANGLSISKDEKKLITTQGFNTYFLNSNNKQIQVFKETVQAEFLGFDSINNFDNELPNSTCLYTIGTDSSLRFFSQNSISDTEKYQAFIKIKIKGQLFYSTSFSFDKKWMVTIGIDSTIRIWNLEELFQQQILSGNKTLIITDYESVKHKIKLDEGVHHVLFSPTENLFIAICIDNIIRLCTIEGKILAEYSGHSDIINTINFSRDGKLLASGSNDKTIRLWEVSNSSGQDLNRNELMVFSSHTEAVSKVLFSPDGKYILSASLDHTVRLMPISVAIVLDKINKEKTRGDIYNLSVADKKVFGIK